MGAGVKEQYVGDINDYRKYALLRALSCDGVVRIGVCWMLTASDDSSDGNKLAYLSQPERHRHFDPELFDILAHAAAEPDRRRLQTIEESGAIPGARYFNAALADEAAQRRSYMTKCLAEFVDVDLVFFDPDNGLETPSTASGRKNSSKYVYLDEISEFYGAGKSVLVYQHFPRKERTAFVADCVERLAAVAPDAAIWTYRTKHVVFLLLVNPENVSKVEKEARSAATRWSTDFIAGELVRTAQGSSLAHRLLRRFK